MTFWSGLAQEFGPVTAFFITTLVADFMTGVLALVIATVLSIVWTYVTSRRVPWFAVFAGSTVIITGLLTLGTSNPRWVTLEYTLSNVAFSVAMLGGTWLGYLPMKRLFVALFAITDAGWRTLALRWGWAFMAGALGSELVWYFYGEPEWAWYRFGTALAFLLFGVWQFRVSRRERLPEATVWGLRQ